MKNLYSLSMVQGLLTSQQTWDRIRINRDMFRPFKRVLNPRIELHSWMVCYGCSLIH